MIDPQLRRPVWLTADQRDVLYAAVNTVRRHLKDPSLLFEIERQLLEVDTYLELQREVQFLIKGLHLPEDIRPVYLSVEEITTIGQHGSVPRRFVRLLTSDAAAHHRSRKKPVPEEPPPPKRQRRKRNQP